MLLKEIKLTDLDPNRKYVFVLPMGATEQHGPFLPFGTDSYIQDALLKKAIESFPEVMFLPTLQLTCSKEHRGFPGTVWIEKDTMYQVFKDICTSLQDLASDIVFMSAHGGNIGITNRFVQNEQGHFGDTKLHHLVLEDETLTKMEEAWLGGPIDMHAGNTEISMMLAIDETLVAVPPSDYPKPGYDLEQETDFFIDSTKDGILDNHPRWVVSRVLGEKIIELYSEKIRTELHKIIDR